MRRFATAAMREANELVARLDARGRAGGAPRTPSATSSGAAAAASGRCVLGSHLDSVADAGRYDGILGVLVGARGGRGAAASAARVEVVAFADEEGLRFQSTFLGEPRVVGRFAPRSWLDLRDADGVTLRRGARRRSRAAAARPARDAARLLRGPHRAGPGARGRGAPLGVVTAIAGQSRFNLAFDGHAGHAGTTPMTLRRDALAAAAEFVLAAERSRATSRAWSRPSGGSTSPRGAST